MNLLFFLLLATAPFEQTRTSIDAGEIFYDSKTEKTCAKDVTLTFKDGSKLISRKALVETEGSGNITATGVDDELLVYTGLAEEKKPFVIKAKKMCVALEPELIVVASGSVQVSYEERVTAYGDMATYRGSGEVSLTGGKAHVVHENGAEIFATKFTYSPILRQLDAYELELCIPELGATQKVMGNAKVGRFYVDEDRLHFANGAEIEVTDQVTAKTDGPLDLTLVENELEKMVAVGSTEIQSANGQHVKCPGKVLFVPGRKHLEAKAFEKEQITLADSQGSLSADQIRLQFLEPKTLNEIDKVMLKGNVKLSGISFFPEQYVLAHEVRLDLQKKKALLKATENDPVLFYDPEQNIELSAPKIAVKKLPDGKLKAQGSGTVRLKFTKDEQNKIKLFF